MTVAGTRADEVVVARRLRTGAGTRVSAVQHALRRNPTILIGGAILLALVLASVFAPLLAPADPVKAGFRPLARPPPILGSVSGFVPGSDNLGRDVLSRILSGGRSRSGSPSGAWSARGLSALSSGWSRATSAA